LIFTRKKIKLVSLHRPHGITGVSKIQVFLSIVIINAYLKMSEITIRKKSRKHLGVSMYGAHSVYIADHEISWLNTEISIRKANATCYQCVMGMRKTFRNTGGRRRPIRNNIWAQWAPTVVHVGLFMLPATEVFAVGKTNVGEQHKHAV